MNHSTTNDTRLDAVQGDAPMRALDGVGCIVVDSPLCIGITGDRAPN